MRTIKTVAIAFCMLAAIACQNRQSKKIENDTSSIQKPVVDKSLVREAGEVAGDDAGACDSIAKEILTTSDRYKKLTKGLAKAVINNGGLSFGVRLDGSPGPSHDKTWIYSKTYDFTLYEMYSDRKLNTARFSFDPVNQQLYEYDEVHNQLTPIEFDRKLLVKYDTVCKK